MHTHGESPQNNAGLLTKSEAAELLKVSGRTIDNWLRRNILPYSKIGDSRNAVVRIRRADVELMLDAHRVAA